MKLTAKKIQNWIEETAKEDWKYHKAVLKESEKIRNWKDYIACSYDILDGDEYTNASWSAGYISGLKAVLENIKIK
jgi:hypothetical protein